MPNEGIECSLKLVGNFGERKFNMLLCGEPSHEIEVRENNQALSDVPPPRRGLRHAGVGDFPAHTA